MSHSRMARRVLIAQCLLFLTYLGDLTWMIYALAMWMVVELQLIDDRLDAIQNDIYKQRNKEHHHDDD